METTLTQSASLPLKYEVALAWRSASRLSCGVPEAAVVNPGSSKITHEPLIQFRQGEGHGRPFGGHLDLGTGSYVGAAVTVYSLPLRLRTTGG